jgi:hypothetical protein
MRQAWHIFRKDVAHLWPHVTIVLLLVAAFIVSNRDEQQAILGQDLLGVLVPAAYAWLIVTVVHQEALPGHRQFWLTRPYCLGSLVAAKILFIVLFVCGSMLTKDVLIAARLGHPGIADLTGLMLRQLAWTSWVVLPAFAAGVVTRNLQETGLVGGALALFYGLAGILVRRSFWPGIEWVRDYLGMLVLFTLGVGIVLWQYFRRETSKAILAVACCAAIIIIGLPLLPWGFGFGVQMVARRPRVDLQSARITTDMTSQARAAVAGERGRDPVMIALPVTISGFPRGTSLVPDGVRAVLSSGERELWHSGWQQTWVGRSVDTYRLQVFYMDSSAYRSLENASVTVKLSLALTLLEDEPASRVPVRERAFTVFGERCENQSRQNDPPFVRCLAAIKAPRAAMVGLEAGGLSQTVAAHTGTWSYAPYEAVLDLSPVQEQHLPIVGTPESCEETRKLWNTPDAQFVFTPQRPVAHFRRELEFPSVRLADYALAPDRAVFTVQGPCGK